MIERLHFGKAISFYHFWLEFALNNFCDFFPPPCSCFHIRKSSDLLGCNKFIICKYCQYSAPTIEIYFCHFYDFQERHLKLVNNYLKKCKREDGIYDFSLLPDDDYIHYYMAHHISFVNENDIIGGVSLDDIYFDLSFVEKKLQKDPKDLLWDYQCPAYKHLFKNVSI